MQHTKTNKNKTKTNKQQRTTNKQNTQQTENKNKQKQTTIIVNNKTVAHGKHNSSKRAK